MGLCIGLAGLVRNIPLLCVKAWRDTDLDYLSIAVFVDCVFSLAGLIALIPGLRQTMNTCWLSIGER